MEGSSSYAALAALSDDLSRIAAAIAPRVVTIDTGRRRSATGTVWRDGVVVTTAHAIRDTEHLHVVGQGNGRRAATFGGWDLGSDLAVLKVEGLKGAESASAAGEAQPLRVGELAVVLAGGVGGPSARLTMVASVGRLERLRRGAGGSGGGVIELDIAPFAGFSGGPLVDTHGRIVAINTAGLVSGVALALPLDAVSRVVDELLVRGRIARGYLGVGVQPVRVPRPANAGGDARSGLLIHSIEAGGPAAAAGALVGDILVSIEGSPLDTPMRLLEELGGERVGQSVRLGVIRGGNSNEITVVVGERPQRSGGRRCHAR